jgi:hypothetical protein
VRLSGNGALRAGIRKVAGQANPDRHLRPQRYGLSGSGGETVKRLMRDFKGMKRQRGRNRGGGGGNNNSKPQHNVNRAFESNGPDNVKIRGNAQHVFEKYQQLSRDATAAGDRVLGENYLQHAEHYFRILRAVQPNRPASEILGRDALASGFDIDFEDESGAQAGVSEETSSEGGDESDNNNEARGERQDRDRQDRDREWRDRRDERPRDERPRDDRQRDYQSDRQRDDRPRDDRPRDDRPRDERPREERPRDERPRDERPRDDRPREDRPRSEVQGDRPPRRERFRDRDSNRDRPRDPLAVVEPEAAPLVAVEVESGPRLRSQDGSESHAPAFLQARPETPRPVEAAAEEGEVRKPRRRRAPRSFEGGEGEAPAAPSETEDA